MITDTFADMRMNIDHTIVRIRDRKRYLKSAVASVIATSLLSAVQLLGYIWLNGKLEDNPGKFVPRAWIVMATFRTMAIVWGMLLGGSIGWLINEVRRCTMREVVIHLVDRVSKLESQIQELTIGKSEQPDAEVQSEGAPSD